MSYDVRFQVDGHQFRVGFEKKGWADSFADKLQEHFANGCLFDPAARRFVRPDDSASADQGPTFFEFTREYVQRKWPTWQPSATDGEWEAFFTRWSLLLRSIDDGHLHDFLERVRTTATDGSPRPHCADYPRRHPTSGARGVPQRAETAADRLEPVGRR